MEHTVEEYINAHRTVDLMVKGPIEDIHNTKELVEESRLIEQKISKLSRKNRDRIQSLVRMGTDNYNRDKENNNTECWDKLQKIVKAMTEIVESLHTN